MGFTSIIIPTLNEEAHIEKTLAAVNAVRGVKQVIVADGGSQDATVARARLCGATVLDAPRGRGNQLRAAARMADGDVLWFLHADTSPFP